MTTAFPLTPLQQGMYLESAGSSQPWIYLEQIICHLDDEPIDAAAMRAAWTDIAAKHPALRLTITLDETLSQQVNAPSPIEVTFLDWSQRSASEISADLETFLVKDRAEGVAADHHPGFRLTLIKTGQKNGKLIWTFPHTLLDGRSFALVLTDVFARYDDHCDGSAGQIAVSEVIPNFAHHCQAVASMDHSLGVDHFAEVLQGWEGGDGLLDREAEPARAVYVENTLTKQRTDELAALAQQSGVPMSTLIMTAWGVVVARMTGQGDTVFGNTLSGRHVVDDSPNALGCFIVTVPMRLRLKPSLTIGEALTDMRSEQINLRPFEQTPLTQIKAKTDVPPGVALFDTLVMFETATLDQQMKRQKGKWAARRVDLLEEGDVPVTLAAYQGDALRLALEYDPSQVADGPRLARYLVQFLTNLANAAPSTPLAQISMLSQEETAALRVMSGETIARENGAQHCLDLFASGLASRPDHDAVTQEGNKTLNYCALDQASNQLAHVLIENGVQPQDVVGICTARSPLFAVALLAIWKAGAAFVPMDPTYPKETLDIIAEDSGTRLILTDDTAPTFATPVLDLSHEAGTITPQTAPKIDLSPNDPAYVIFTSGSTGRPKGVQVSHAALAAHSLAAISLYELSSEDRALQFASLSFDVALEEIVATLMAGATLVMRTPEMSQSTAEFLERCAALEISVLNLPTGFWVALTDALEADQGAHLPETVRMVVVGGERVPLSVLRRWHQLAPDVAWVNGYGPTETTITCTAHRLNPGDLDRASVPIGKPLRHAAAWVLASDGSLAPEGVKGELWISGPAVAMGYIQRPETTAERFVVPGFDPEVGRSYATGDQAFWNDELLNYVGRVDRQIKLRGFRIEPGQIEQVLEAQDDVGRAHVAVFNPSGTTPRLVVWYSSADMTQPVSPGVLRARLAEALPTHMRPDPVHVDHWPQTPGGKIDTAKLPEPKNEPATNISAAPDSPLTLKVAKLFADILKISHMPSNVSFFDQGGDSLLLLRLLAQIEKEFGTRLKPTALYAEPTPVGVVRALQSKDPDPLVVIPIQARGGLAPLYAVHVLGDNGSFFRPLAAELGDDQPLFGLTVGLLSEDTPTAIKDIARFYLHQIERHHPEGPVSLVAVSAGSYVTFELAQQLIAAGRQVNGLIFLDASGPGGRPRVGKLGRIGVHARLLARHPGAYFTKTIASKIEEVRHSIARKKLSKQEGEGDAVQSVAAFVAANTMAIESYNPAPYPGPITVIRAGHDLFDSPEAVQTGLGWNVVAGGTLEVYDVPGEHLSILEPPYVPELARRISTVLRGYHTTKSKGCGISEHP